MKRDSFEDMAIKFAISASQRSEDPYKKVGVCILNKDGRVLSIGYNGLLPKQTATKSFWANRDERRKFMIHAETNALSCISRYDEPTLLASTLLPCSCCAINIASYGIKNIIYLEDYQNDRYALDIFKFYKIKIKKYNSL